MSARKSSHRTIFLIVSSGSPLALIASSLRSISKKPVCPMTRSFHPPMVHCNQRVRFAATWREEFFEVPIKQLRQKSPEKYAEIAAKLIAAIEPRGEGFDSCRSKEELGRALLESVGANEPDDDSIQQAIQLNDKFIDNLQHVHQCALASEEEMH